ncbi:MAG: hypothetical protein IPM59_03455 [Chloracidobacterium sp.]|nr:hypothetical protein [Chloracidobacterium sp.]
MKKQMDVIELSNSVGEIARAECEKARIPFVTPLQVGLGSGFDVALTLMEQSVGLYKGLSQEKKRRVVEYFRAEAERSKAVDPYIVIWYLAWASVIEAEPEDSK